MTRRDLVSVLAGGERLLLDGANGTELKRRGITNSRNPDGTANRGITSRSATAVVEAPEQLGGIHEDYLRAGADIVTTNTFNTSRSQLMSRGLGHLADLAEEYTRRAAEITLVARDRVKPQSWVAGSISAPRRRRTAMAEDDMAEEYRVQAKVLVEAGVDVLLLEYVRDLAVAVLALDAVAGFGVPVFLGICNVTTEGTLDDGEAVDRLAETLGGRQADAVLTMCSRPDAISATLPRLRQGFGGPMGGYSNIVDMAEKYTPEAYAESVGQWLAMGAQIVGGCCGSTPDHIAALRPLVDQVSASPPDRP